jgi:hypothetical protein
VNRFFLAVLALVISLGPFVSRQSFSQDNLPLSEYMDMTRSKLASDRIVGFNSIAKYWQLEEGFVTGFSDTPIENTTPKVEKKPIDEDELNQIAGAIEKGTKDPDAKVREAAASALAKAPRSSAAVQTAILASMLSEDPVVNWHVMKQRTGVWPKIDLVIERLIENLSSRKWSEQSAAHEVLREYGEIARPFSRRILDAILLLEKQPNDRRNFFVFWDIGLTEEASSVLANRGEELSEEEAAIAAIALLEHFEPLQLLTAKQPKILQAIGEYDNRLFAFLCKHQYESNKTRDWLASAISLPVSVMGMLGEHRFIEEISKAEESSSRARMPFLLACKRACGAKADLVIDVDATHPVTFRPSSAWPQVDKRRMHDRIEGHADGLVKVMVTGEIRAADGSHPNEVRFFRTNDSMLLGTQANYSVPLMYNREGGRFIFLTEVFAAFSVGKGDRESGPYQTGSAQIRIEAPGLKPMTVQFFDEMPDVRITLDRAE